MSLMVQKQWSKLGVCKLTVRREQMEASRTTVSISIELALGPMVSFDVFIEELTVALAQSGMSFEAGANGRITEAEFEVGRVIAWKPGELIQLQWHQAD